MLGGMIVWTVHFFSLYAIASIFLTTPLARGLALLVSGGCLVADAWLFRRAFVAKRDDEIDGWNRKLSLLMTGISALAVIWQTFPAILA